jgi:16S rRNA (guanine527-N7)-methyltransferase
VLDALLEGESGALARLGAPAESFGLLRDILLDVRQASTRANLVGDASDEALFSHLMDSLQALADPAARREDARIVDVGTGGGFPGLVLLAVRTGWRGTLVDSVKKKTDALGLILAGRLGGRGEALWGRAETLARETGRRDSYDLAFCRAVGRLTTVMELTLPFLKPGGFLLAHRGHEAPDEAEASRSAAELLGGRMETPTPYRLPGLDKTRYIVRVAKTGLTPPTYPRRNGVPAKRPLA